MKIYLADELLKNYPTARIGVVRANVKVAKSSVYTEQLQVNLVEDLTALGLDINNYINHPAIASWRHIYQTDFGVNPKTYQSSVEALVRRVLTKKSLWNISNIVDLYNCCSVKYLFSMGAYDVSKIAGDIQIRYGKENEFFQGIGQKDVQPVLSNQIVYADNEKILCWLWNHKDSQFSCIDNATTQAIFFIDSIGNPQHSSLEQVVRVLSQHLTNLNYQVEKFAIVSVASPELEV